MSILAIRLQLQSQLLQVFPVPSGGCRCNFPCQIRFIESRLLSRLDRNKTQMSADATAGLQMCLRCNLKSLIHNFQ